jgi:hypothetical protein
MHRGVIANFYAMPSVIAVDNGERQSQQHQQLREVRVSRVSLDLVTELRYQNTRMDC